MGWERDFKWSAIAIAFITWLQMPIALANHENISITLQPSPNGVYVHGDRVTTSIAIRTAPIFFGHEPTNDQNETRYFVVYKDKLADHPDIPIVVENRALFVPTNGLITNNYTRPFIEGYWLLSAEVYEDNINGEKLLDTPWQQRIVVQSVLYPIFLNQTTASINSAKAATDGAYWTAVAAIVGPAVAIGGVIAAISYERHKHRVDHLRDWHADYHVHSVKIITALKAWYDSVQYPYLYYDAGRFFERIYAETKSPLAEEIEAHLGAYHELDRGFKTLKTEAETLTNRIRELFTAQDRDSFQKIIVEKLQMDCPTLLRESREYGANYIGGGQYVDSHVFFEVFNEVSLKLKGQNGKQYYIEKSLLVPGNSTYKYDGKFSASGDDPAIQAYAKAISDLRGDSRIIAIIKEYDEIKAKLQDIENSRGPELRDRVGWHYTRIINGDILRWEDACRLCPVKPRPFGWIVRRILWVLRVAELAISLR